MGQFDLGPKDMADIVGEFADNGWINILGGCCGTTPDHISAPWLERIEGVKPKQDSERSSLDATVGPATNGHASLRFPFTMVGERTNVTGSRKFARSDS